MKRYKRIIKACLLAAIPPFLRKEIESRGQNELKKQFLRFGRLSYSQYAEDLVIASFFQKKKQGFYVDIGAHHPMRFSNTYYFYQRGWKGINIDAMPGSMQAFNELRPRDINLEFAVGNKGTDSMFYMFDEPALNTLSSTLKCSRLEKDPSRKLINEKRLSLTSLANILDTYLLPLAPIDFMTIDVEGMELHVLESNDWSKYRPFVIVVELLNIQSIDHALQDQVCRFLQAQGYRLRAVLFNSLVFQESDTAIC